MRINYAIVFVSDMKRSVAFYRDVVGLPLKFQTPGWTEFATEGATLALHQSDHPNPAQDTYEQPGRCRTGFTVPDLDAFHNRMIEKGVRCIQAPEVLFGARLALYQDPDGMPFGVSEEQTST